MPFDYDHWRGKPKRACFRCRKCFKDRTFYHYLVNTTTCPNCGGELHKMGTHFKAPKRSDEKAWEAVEMLYDAGVRYDVLDMHSHYWPEQYVQYGVDFESFILNEIQVRTAYLRNIPLSLGTIGIKLPQPEDGTVEPRQAIRTVGFRAEIQWPGPRPTHPREVPAFLKWWRERQLDRIAVVVEACERMGYEPPEGLQGRVLLEEIRKRFNSSLTG